MRPPRYVREEIVSLIQVLERVSLGEMPAGSRRDALSTDQSAQRDRSQEAADEKSVHRKAHR